MNIYIRKTNSNDGSLIVEFIRKLAKYEKLLHEVEISEQDIVRDLFGKSPKVFCEIIELDKKPIGFALYYYTYSTFRGKYGIWLEDLFIDENARGSGAGKKLMAHLAQKCQDEELARLEWWVLDWNVSAIDFYISLGAIMQNEWSVCRIDGSALNYLANSSSLKK